VLSTHVCFYSCRPGNRSLPSAFLERRAKVAPGRGLKGKAFTYDRDIICLPNHYSSQSGIIKIPRRSEDREFLAKNGLIGKIRLSSDMCQREIELEITSVFKEAMKDDILFRFNILQSAGGKSRQLIISSLSPGLEWTASAVAGKNAKVPIYILALDKLHVSI